MTTSRSTCSTISMRASPRARRRASRAPASRSIPASASANIRSNITRRCCAGSRCCTRPGVRSCLACRAKASSAASAAANRRLSVLAVRSRARCGARNGACRYYGCTMWRKPARRLLFTARSLTPEATREPYSVMTRKLFGTDGIRGTANLEPMTPETALQVAMATGRVLRRGLHRNLVVIGKDTRLSGYMIEPALTAGFIAMGMDVDLVGPMPTPAIAMLTHTLRADLGVMISAPHNPFEDNGIKLFGPDGNKLSDEIESAIEAALDDGNGRAAASGLGRA